MGVTLSSTSSHAVPFADFVSERRKERGLRQSDFYDQSRGVGFKQGMVSGYEKGRQLPRDSAFTGANMLHYAKRLQVSVRKLRGLARQQRRAAREAKASGDPKAHVLTKAQVVKLLGGFRAARDDQVDYWFIGPEMLDILHDNDVKKRWAHGLMSGRHYKLIWLLDLFPSLVDANRARDELLQALHDIRDLVEGDKNTGKVVHFRTFAIHGSGDRLGREYQRVERSFEALDAGNLGDTATISEAKQARFLSPYQRIQLSQLWSRFGSVIAMVERRYDSKSGRFTMAFGKGVVVFACQVKARPPVFIPADEDLTREILDVLREFEAEWNSEVVEGEEAS